MAKLVEQSLKYITRYLLLVHSHNQFLFTFSCIMQPEIKELRSSS